MTKKTQMLLEEIQSSLTTQDAANIIEELIKNKMVEIENLQYESNLKMYEEYNFILMSKIKQMHAVLSNHGIDYEVSSSEDDDEDKEMYDVRNIDDDYDLDEIEQDKHFENDEYAEDEDSDEKIQEKEKPIQKLSNNYVQQIEKIGQSDSGDSLKYQKSHKLKQSQHELPRR